MSVSDSLARRSFFKCAAGASLALAGCKAAEKEETVQEVGKPKWTLPEKNRVKREFDQVRSRKMIFVSHCTLNQNARITTAADFPAMFVPLIDWLKQNNIGVIQMPCPELRVLGLGRKAVREGLETEEGHAHLHQLIDDLIYEIREYQFQGFDVIGILGKQGSPACGVTRTWLDGRQQDGQGVFIRLLKERLAAENLDIEVEGVADHEQEAAIKWVKERV